MIPEIQIKILYFILNITFFPFFPFLPSIVIEWNKVDLNLWSAASLSVFKKNLLKFIKPSPSSVFNFHNRKGMKYLKRLHLGLSNLREHKFKHNFQGSLNSFCSCGFDVETNTHFFLYCALFSNHRSSHSKVFSWKGVLKICSQSTGEHPCRFWNQPYLSNQALSSTWPKCEVKSLNILTTKRAFKMK